LYLLRVADSTDSLDCNKQIRFFRGFIYITRHDNFSEAWKRFDLESSEKNWLRIDVAGNHSAG